MATGSQVLLVMRAFPLHAHHKAGLPRAERLLRAKSRKHCSIPDKFGDHLRALSNRCRIWTVTWHCYKVDLNRL